jgi:membrane fusion protein, multidrug efflux system
LSVAVPSAPRGHAVPRVLRRRFAVFSILLSALPLLCSCGKNDASAQSPGAGNQAPVPVAAADVVQRDTPVQLRAFAAVEPYTTVTIKPQVAGQLTTVHFAEGQDVKRGDLLFTIDPRPFQAELQAANGNLARDEALARDAESEAARQASLFKSSSASQREYESAKAIAESRRAQVLADQAAVDKAGLDLEYCSIRSPIDGRTGSLLVHAGNIVKENDTTLVTLNQVCPIYVTFSVPEQHLEQIKQYRLAGELQVSATIPQDEGPPEQGVLSFLDNQVDRTTGMITLKGTFANEKRRLWPGQYVNVLLTLTVQPNTVLVPTQALQTGQNGQFVYVVKADATVEMRPVTPERAIDGETVISRGLAVGERVVTDGQLRSVRGSRVAIKNQATSAKDSPK